MVSFKNILQLCKKTGLLTETTTEIAAGPLGLQLLENLKREWLHANVYGRDINVFLSTKDSVSEVVKYAKDMCGGRLPFGIAQMDTFSVVNNNERLLCFPKRQIGLETQTFVPSGPLASQFFYSWQNRRRIWWRKISAVPSRYVLTDIRDDDDNKSQTVDIVANYPWGSHVVERVSLESFYDEVTQRVTSIVYDVNTLVNAACDAYDEAVPLFRFHRRIAPVKISFVVSGTNTKELNQLAQYLCGKLRRIDVCVLYSASTSRETIEAQVRRCDELGIPYTVFVNDTTLKNGMAYLRNRDTTVKEQVHVSNLTHYVQQLLKNF